MPFEGVVPDGWTLEFEDDFDGPDLDRSRWLPHHLPQWSSTAQSAARYELADGCLHLRIDADQQPWCPEFDGDTRVSSVQTGVFAGPPGSTIGQHRFEPDVVVREAQASRRLYTPQYGAFVLRARADLDPDSMAALWMIGYEDEPERSGEICICEIFGSDVTADAARIGMGVHPFGDHDLVDDFEKVDITIDIRQFHEYAAVWTPGRITFHVDGVQVRAVDQAPDYPMQFMLGVYDFAHPRRRDASRQVRFVIDSFRAYRSRSTARI
jgi:hypothetical protein